MKNSFCRICRGRFNLKYPPAAVDSKKKKSSTPPRTISVRIGENGEISENICWDCEETLLGFHKITSTDNSEDEEVVVDDDEILYKRLETSKRNHRLSKETEIIEIDSSDSDVVIVPEEDKTIVEAAPRTVEEQSTIQNGGAKRHKRSSKAVSKHTADTMKDMKEDTSPRGRVVESKQCPICQYHSGIEYEVVCHIRQTHPQYIGDYLRFDHMEGDPQLTRRIIFAQLWTFFECKECGKIYDRFWPHRKHIKTHNRNKFKNPLTIESHINNNNNNNNNSDKKESTKLPSPQPQPPPPPVPLKRPNGLNKSLKRPLDEINDSNKSAQNGRAKILKISNDDNPKDIKKSLIVKLHKSEPKTIAATPKTVSMKTKQQSQSEKSKSSALLRKQQQLQARREKRRQKKEEEKKAKKKIVSTTTITTNTSSSKKPTFKMPTQPAPRASSVVKPIVQKLNNLKLSLICKLCSKTFPGIIAWNMHMMRDHNPPPTHDVFQIKKQRDSNEFVCRSCDKKFDDKSQLLKHDRFYHRRKNRKIEMEVNGNNDQKEVCCQSEPLNNDKSKNCDDQQLLPIITESIHSESIANNKNEEELFKSTSVAKWGVLCQYCGSLLPSDNNKAAMDSHESEHIANGNVKRISVTQQPKV